MTNEDNGLDETKPPTEKQITRSEWKAIIKAMHSEGFPDDATDPMSVGGVENLVPEKMRRLIVQRQSIFAHRNKDNSKLPENVFQRLMDDRTLAWRDVNLMPDDMPDDPPPPLSDGKPKRKRPSRKKGNK